MNNSKILFVLALLGIFVIGLVPFYMVKSISTMPQTANDSFEVKNVSLSTSPIPQTEAEIIWEKNYIEELGLSFLTPPEMDVTSQTEVNSETGAPYLTTLYVQRTEPATNYYQLYGIIQTDIQKLNSLELFKSELEIESIEETTISGKIALKGQLVGERNRFVTYILLDGNVLKLYTAQPTLENKLLTDQILETFVFEEN